MQTGSWSPPRDLLDINPDQVDVWRISLDLSTASIDLLESALSSDESQRAAHFHFPEDRNRYIVAHGSLREILARYLRCKPRELNFNTDDYGKPALKVHKLEFNLSHSGEYALVAVTQRQKVGVDVERIRSNLEIKNIASRYFSQREVSELLALPSEQRVIGFFNCWARKEAYIKANGLGLSLPLESFDVSLIPGEPAILRATRPDSNVASRWTLHSLDVASGYASAIAIEGSNNLEIRLWDWNVS